MNIVTILNKLKDAKMVTETEESLNLFSECFNKFGISLLLLKDENKFNRIVDILDENNIPLQKMNGIYALRIFAVALPELENIITEYFSINELDFLRFYPEIIAEPQNVHFIAERMRKLQNKGISYRTNNEYDISLLFSNEEILENNTNVNAFLKRYLKDVSLVDKLDALEANNDEEDFNIALELQKVENKICEEFLFPVEDGWKIVINNKEVNSFQEVKNTINTITKLNLSITFNDALLLVLFYRTHLTTSEIEDIILNVLFKEGK